MTKDQAKAIIEKLVNRYAEQQKAYHAADYNETKTRRDFIDPFFKALGWDMDNEQDVAEPYREVIHEDKVKIQGKVKAPDYGFRLQGAKDRLFFVEAKKPSVPLKTNKEAAFQVRRYGWNSRVAVSILTNFEEFIVYDCSKKPNANDSTSVARLKTISYDQFLQEFDFIYDTFSREAVVKGRFDTYVKSDTAKKGTVTPDKDFVNSLEEWRRFIAIDVARNNLKLNEDELNFAVQLIIDRLIFLRFCEDRGVEHYGQLKSAVAKGSAYEQLHDIFIAADDKYNSGLFDFDKDKITQGLKVTNKVIKGIIDDMYYPLSQYDFKALPVEVLGNAYEQFLGKVIRINKAHHAVIEEKPEVRKAGGVFYTPQYIVDYIVENTVGKLIAGKTPKEIEKIKIVDPACGSGSFLLGAFDYLLKFHQNYYHQNPPSAKSGIITPIGTLSTAEKKKILLNNIYGVDLDANAVEVSKLSLLLKCMEGETEASIKQQITMFNERVLPDLDNNIKDGNSLVDTDIYDSELDFGEEKKIKPFSWKKQFSEIFKQGGFDAVIGNPPYVRQELFTSLKSYLESHYKVYDGTADLYSYFFEKGIDLLKQNGFFGIIVANKWMRSNYGKPLRVWLKNRNITEIIDFGDLPVFQGAIAYPCIFISENNQKNKKTNIVNVKTLDFDSLTKYINSNKITIELSNLDNDGWQLTSNNEKKILDKIKSKGVSLDKYVNQNIYYGIKTGLNEAFVIDEETKRSLIKENKNSAELIKPFLTGRDIKRYQTLISAQYLIFTRKGTDIEKYPAIKKHLNKFKSKLSARAGSQAWFELQASPESVDRYEKTKIIFPAIVKSASFTLDKNKHYSNDKTTVILSEDLFLLGILNSKACDYFIKSIASTKQGGYFEYKPMYVSKSPIPDATEKDKKSIQELVKTILTLNNELKEIKLQTKIDQIKQRIEHAEDKINQLVYELYDLTSEEITVIEEASK